MNNYSGDLPLKLAEMEKKCRQLEQRLHQSDERFLKIFHSSPFLLMIATLKEGRIIDINEAGASLAGYKRAELIGRILTDLNLFADPNQGDLLIRRVLNEGTVRNMEVGIRTKSGSTRTILLSADPITVNDEPCLIGVSAEMAAHEEEGEALRKAEEKFRLLGENSLEGVAIIQDRRLVFCNRAFAEISGYSVEELLSLSPEQIADMTHAEDRELYRKRFGDPSITRPRLPQHYEGRLIRKDQSVRWVEVYAVSTEWRGKPAGQVVQIDITDRKLAEHALRESEERFRLIEETVDEIFWIFDVERKHTAYLSPAFDRIMGFSREKLIGNPNPELNWVHPEDRELVNSSFRNLNAGGLMNFEYRILRPDGALRHIWHRGYPVRDQTGKLKQYVGVGEDITAFKRVQEALKESTEYLHQLINRIGDPVFVENDQHRFVLVNDAMCAFTGWERDQLLGKTIFETNMPKDEATYIWEQDGLVLEESRELIVEEQATDGQGRKHSVITRKTLLTDKAGNRQIVGIIKDITEYKRLQAQFMQSQKMEAVGLLAGGIAHDFNNLLSVIRGYAEMLAEGLNPDDRRHKDAIQIMGAANQAASLTTQLLAFSRKQMLQPEIMDLSSTITGMNTMLRRIVRENIDLVMITRPGLWPINADPIQIQQIVMNLVVNARDAMLEGGKLTIETANVDFDEGYVREHPQTQEGSFVMLAISDNGVGMDEATQAHLFEPFFTTKGIGKGTGLGLSTVYGIVKQSNGFIWVYSEPGKGTTFKLYFPRVESPMPEIKAEEETGRSLQGWETVLVVEDSQAVRELIGRILRERGYSVIEASDGNEALRFANDHSGEIHLVITDVIMPGLGGKDLASQFRVIRPGTKALFISGYTDDAIVNHGILDAGIAFLQKPFTAERLAYKVRETLESQ